MRFPGHIATELTIPIHLFDADGDYLFSANNVVDERANKFQTLEFRKET